MVVWIDKALDDSAVAMQFVQKINFAMVSYGGTNTEMYNHAMHKFVKNPGNEYQWNALSKICNQLYWKRRWIFQEVALATRCIIQCGDNILDGDAFGNACLAIVRPNGLLNTFEPGIKNLMLI